MKKDNRNIIRAGKHLERFMDEYGLFPTSGRGVVAISGGMDSMLLAFFLSKIYKKRGLDLTYVHINHGTRAGNRDEEKGVSKYCRTLDIEGTHFTLDGYSGPNFEKWARDERYRCFKAVLNAGDTLYMAHHIDDSFEWSMMAKFKSGSVNSSLGIPVVRGSFVRPFMSMSKEQIRRCALALDLPYYEDPTNSNISFERNYLRNEVIPLIKDRFPKYLKHYVYSSNELARKLNLHHRVNKKKIIKVETGFGIMITLEDLSLDFRGFDEEIIEVIRSLSSSDRGVLRTQVKKLIEAQINGKSGPLLFSGGVNCYLLSGILFFCKINSWSKIFIQKSSQIPAASLREEFLAGKIGVGILFSRDKLIKNNISPVSKTSPILEKSRETLEKTDYNAYYVSRLIREIEKSRGKYLNSTFFLPDIE